MSTVVAAAVVTMMVRKPPPTQKRPPFWQPEPLKRGFQLTRTSQEHAPLPLDVRDLTPAREDDGG